MAPEEIAAHRPLDRAAGVLGDQEPAVFAGRETLLRLKPERQAERDKGAVDREAALRGQDDALRADGPLAGDLAEKHKGRVIAAERRAFFRMFRHPAADIRHCHLLARQLAAVEQQAADRDIGLAVAAVIADARDLAIGQLNAARALDLEKEGGDRVVDPEELEPLPVQGAVLDLGAGKARRIGRAAIKRGAKGPAGATRAIKADLEITGKEALGRAVVAGEPGHKACFEELPGRLVVARRQLLGGGAERAPVGGTAEIAALGARIERRGLGTRCERAAGFQKGRDRGGDRIILPADEVVVASRRQRQARAGFLLQQIIGQRAGDQRQREQDNKKNPGAAARPPA